MEAFDPAHADNVWCSKHQRRIVWNQRLVCGTSKRENLLINCKCAIGAVRYHIRGWCAVVKHVKVNDFEGGSGAKHHCQGKIAACKQKSETNESFDFRRGEWGTSALWHNGHQQSARSLWRRSCSGGTDIHHNVPPSPGGLKQTSDNRWHMITPSQSLVKIHQRSDIKHVSVWKDFFTSQLLSGARGKRKASLPLSSDHRAPWHLSLPRFEAGCNWF